MSRKKKLVLKDELDIKGGGIYCILPYERLNKEKKAVFKIGLATDFNKRMESYFTSYPLGFYYVAFLENPTAKRISRKNGRYELTIKEYYIKIEKLVIDTIIKNGGTLITSTARVHHLNESMEGQTEWVYATENMILDAFDVANKKYGGILHKFHLKGINKIAKSNESNKPNYIAEIVYPLTKYQFDPK
jgi:hypothetical protein